MNVKVDGHGEGDGREGERRRFMEYDSRKENECLASRANDAHQTIKSSTEPYCTPSEWTIENLLTL